MITIPWGALRWGMGNTNVGNAIGVRSVRAVLHLCGHSTQGKGVTQGQVPEVWQRWLLGPRREGNVTAPAAQTSLGATVPPATQHVGETHTVLEIIIAGERWLSLMMISARSSTLGLIWAPFTHPDVYFEASTLLEGEQKFILLSVDNEQAVTLKIYYFSFLPLVPPPPNTLKHDTEPRATQSRTACC